MTSIPGCNLNEYVFRRKGEGGQPTGRRMKSIAASFYRARLKLAMRLGIDPDCLVMVG